MKKVILFLSVIGTALLMTSCLDGGSNNYTDNSFVYLEMDERGQIYGKTFSRYSPSRYITTNSMMTMQPGTFKFMIYSWDEERGSTAINVGGQTIPADNVMLIEEVIDISRTYLEMSEGPEVDDPVGFYEILAPLYADSQEFMNDHWVVEYSYWAKKGEKGHIEFYKRDEPNVNGEIVIDVHLSLSGTAEGDTPTRYGDAVALNMSELRATNSDKQELNIRFKYYKTENPNTAPTEVNSENVYKWRLSSEN